MSAVMGQCHAQIHVGVCVLSLLSPTYIFKDFFLVFRVRMMFLVVRVFMVFALWIHPLESFMWVIGHKKFLLGFKQMSGKFRIVTMAMAFEKRKD